ncbi:hypothetical protein D9M09_28625 [Janthinobacterium agaricidamnosum]|uniref:Cell envelope integrity protein CreD n=1 Tax=Janthinobacterium agaricidamnosum TaxID=55508 RepID=A0A3G2EHX2_9BURK|nr:hypothetical protein D9M09_28625 [Janthinobacterium agaricidamnosum]
MRHAKTLLVKALIVFGLMLIIGLPLLMIQETIKERMEFRQEAVNSIAADSVREQTIIGPILVIPYTEQYEERVEVAKGDDKEAKSAVRTELLRRTVQRRLLVYPNNLLLNGNIDTDRRYRGIHQVLVYSGQHAFKGDFTVPAGSQLPRKSPDSRVTLGAPFVALSIEDVRGIRNIPKSTGAARRSSSSRVATCLPSAAACMRRWAPCRWRRRSRCISALTWASMASNASTSCRWRKTVRSASSRTGPSAVWRRFLPSPKFRQINADGFQVEWSISSLATNAQTQLSTIEGEFKVPDSAPLGQIDRFSVGFIEPVNVYSQSDRATKYGLLFVALTFAAFFIFEILKSLPIHRCSTCWWACRW